MLRHEARVGGDRLFQGIWLKWAGVVRKAFPLEGGPDRPFLNYVHVHACSRVHACACVAGPGP